MDIIDRRLNPKNKSLGNRRRFIRRARQQLREAVRERLKDRSVTDVESGEQITISADGIHEPRLVHDRAVGKRAGVLAGNRGFSEGDRIARPGSDGGGRGAGVDHGGEDDFAFALSREEFLDLFFEDLELPDLVKRKIKAEKSEQPQRAGYSTTGQPNRLHVLQTLRRAHARRIALRRPPGAAVAELEDALAALRADPDAPQDRIAEMEEALDSLRRRRQRIAYIDPIDLRFRRFEPKPRPVVQAVMFCLMDVSASMDQARKDLAKRFFLMLHLFLDRHYESVDLVFIRHTSEAAEVDEETFFYGRETGGTVVSSALKEMLKVVEARYSPSDWNIYLAQASDGDDVPSDVEECARLLNEKLLPLCQYAAYVEVGGTVPTPSVLWNGLSPVADRQAHFAMRRIHHPRDIYPVFRGLFSREGETG